MADSSGKRKSSKESQRAVKLIHALDHVLRRRILRALNDAGGPVSPVKIGELLGEPLSNVSYHVNILREYGAVKLKSLQQVRGAMEHFYILTIDDNEAIMLLLAQTKEADDKHTPRKRRRRRKT